MADIVIYNNGLRMAKTSIIFDVIENKELMREWTLAFGISNIDNARKYIQRGAIYEINGQKFDNMRFKRNSGGANLTTVETAYHVSYRLNNYLLPANYCFPGAGTISAIIQDILNVSGATAEFMVGSCEDGNAYSYNPANTQPMTARAAIYGLSQLGSEPSFDNFVINAPIRWGADTGKSFKFGRDLCNIDTEDDQVANTTTYTIDIATLMSLPGGSPQDNFSVGDTIDIQDEIIGEEIVSQRIVCYEKHHDDPSQDKVTIGQFIPDLSDTLQTMQVGINNSVQQATPYNNVSFDRANGIMVVSSDGTIGVKMNAQNCFAVYSISGGVWTLMSELDIDGLQAGTLRMPGSKFLYAQIGYDSNHNPGLFIYKNGDTTPVQMLAIWPASNGGTVIDGLGDITIRPSSGKSIFFQDQDNNILGTTGTVSLGNGSLIFKNGLLNSATGYDYATASFSIAGVGTLYFDHGILMSIK